MPNIICLKNGIKEVQTALKGVALTVTDSNVAQLYPDLCEGAFVIPAGESSKSKEVLFDILTEFASRKLKRGDSIAALGGGVVGDVVGFAAAVYMRGIEWVSIPTTLLSMVDSGIGGKTAIDFGGVKNLIGAFHEATRTIISLPFVETLYEDDWLSGYGEIVKSCLITGEAFSYLDANFDLLADYDRDVLFELVKKCVDIKSEVVRRDPVEHGLRRVLNIGHTVGHALEAADDCRLKHGEYVLKGLMVECTMFSELIQKDYYKRIISMAMRLTTPPHTTAKAALSYSVRDKKNTKGRIAFMIPTLPGEVLDISVGEDEFAERYTRAVKELKGV